MLDHGDILDERVLLVKGFPDKTMSFVVGNTFVNFLNGLPEGANKVICVLFNSGLEGIFIHGNVCVEVSKLLLDSIRD